MNYQEKIRQEIAYYEERSSPKTLLSRILLHPLLFSPSRNGFNYRFPKTKMAAVVRNRILPRTKVNRLLIAPCGGGNEVQYLSGLSEEYYGIDISPLAVSLCPKNMIAEVGDIRDTRYQDGFFDVVVSSLFFHHCVKVGFRPFLDEFYRILKPGGVLVILEPSVLYPLNILTRPLKLLGNPYGEVPDESPFLPSRMIREMSGAGFYGVETQAATFSHCSFPVWLSKIVNRITDKALVCPVIKYFGWMVLFSAIKEDK